MLLLFRKLFLISRNPEAQQLSDAIHTITKLRPGNLSLYRLALQHSSAKAIENSNERLEFLGDAVLSLIIGEYLFKKYPYKTEGFLTEIRSRIVNRTSLSLIAQKIGIDLLLYYNKRTVRESGLSTICGNALEALIGAVYLDKGYKGCQKFVLNQLLHLYIDLDVLIQTDTNYKSKLITWADRNRKSIQFSVHMAKHYPHYRTFIAQVVLEDEVAGKGQGSSKKQAEQGAARAVLADLSLLE